MEVGQLREQDLDAGEDDHVGRVGGLAVSGVTVAVEAVGPLDRPAASTRKSDIGLLLGFIRQNKNTKLFHLHAWLSSKKKKILLFFSFNN